MQFSRRDSLDLGQQLDLPISGEQDPTLSPRVIVSADGGVHNQAEVLMIEGAAPR